LNEEDNVPLFMMPRWLKNQLMVQTSGMDGETKGLILGNLTPVDDLLKTAQGVFGYEGFEEMMHYFVGSSTPILKSVFELGMGRQSFNGQAIGDEDMMEMSITEYMKKQVTRDGLEGLLWRLAVRGRWQPLDVDRLQARISIDTSEDIKLLRRGINRAMQEGDEEQAEAIAMRIIENYRVLWQSGVRHRVPKELWPQFRREEGMLRREGRPIPGANIPIQQPSP
jgi:sRNA-binding carbon storage regulator CsrA